jgi:hypothetical protein
MAQAQAVPENLKAIVRSIVRNNKPDWADAVVLTFGHQTLTACIDPACFRPVIVWWPARRSKYDSGEYYYSKLWEPHTVPIEEGDLKFLETRGLRPVELYLAVDEGERVAIYGVREKRGSRYDTVAPRERLLEL